MAVVAAKWARQCVVGHDDSHARAVPELPGVYIGQNVAAGQSSFVAVVKGWHSEVNNFKYGVGAIDKTKDIGHYTQVVSATVSRIGCGSAKCPNSKTFYVCNYAVGQMGMIKPYKSGTNCADCNKSCSGDSHLCASCPSQVSQMCASYEDDACNPVVMSSRAILSVGLCI
ncbi:cysteine-rich venom protein-like [Gigantopelta aegis]|uniref:cysteine-rich venom protein-like n=1 Tax=Gigantopelta aegis TaxID=1735272 RepID=UPI001B889039|nr:cysteine-rich venom protein-like [Gigantopelta aegis]